MPPADDDDAEQMLARSHHTQEKAKRRQQALEGAQQQRDVVEGTATSSDGLVRAAVDNTGMLVRLELSPSVQDAPPRGLSRAITAVVQRAVADARDQIRQIYVGLLNEGIIHQLPPLPSAPPAQDVRVPVEGSSSDTSGEQPREASESKSSSEPKPSPGPFRRRSTVPASHAEPYDSPLHTWYDQRSWYP